MQRKANLVNQFQEALRALFTAVEAIDRGLVQGTEDVQRVLNEPDWRQYYFEEMEGVFQALWRVQEAHRELDEIQGLTWWRFRQEFVVERQVSLPVAQGNNDLLPIDEEPYRDNEDLTPWVNGWNQNQFAEIHRWEGIQEQRAEAKRRAEQARQRFWAQEARRLQGAVGRGRGRRGRGRGRGRN